MGYVGSLGSVRKAELRNAHAGDPQVRWAQEDCRSCRHHRLPQNASDYVAYCGCCMLWDALSLREEGVELTVGADDTLTEAA